MKMGVFVAIGIVAVLVAASALIWRLNPGAAPAGGAVTPNRLTRLTVAPVTSPAATVLVNGSPLALDPAPVIIDGSVTVPARALAAALQARVDWDAAGRSFLIARGIYRVGLIIGRQKAYVDDYPGTADVAPVIRDDQAMVPVRFVAGGLGAQVRWADGTVIITIPAGQPNSTGTTWQSTRPPGLDFGLQLPPGWTVTTSGSLGIADLELADDQGRTVGGLERLGYYPDQRLQFSLPNHSMVADSWNISSPIGQGKIYVLNRDFPAASGLTEQWTEVHALLVRGRFIEDFWLVPTGEDYEAADENLMKILDASVVPAPKVPAVFTTPAGLFQDVKIGVYVPTHYLLPNSGLQLSLTNFQTALHSYTFEVVATTRSYPPTASPNYPLSMASMLMTVTGGGQPFSPYPTEVQEFGQPTGRVDLKGVEAASFDRGTELTWHQDNWQYFALGHYDGDGERVAQEILQAVPPGTPPVPGAVKGLFRVAEMGNGGDTTVSWTYDNKTWYTLDGRLDPETAVIVLQSMRLLPADS
ncbi:MAG TPA: stalk domain-containing protein [Spirochaetia bacterium]|nr:stalk domain-containing protein [Spirochaetia bacterium]